MVTTLVACGARLDDPRNVGGPAKAALTVSGAVAVESAEHGRFELSLSILPRVFGKGLYRYEGTSYPSTDAARTAVVDEVAFTYPQLERECAGLHPGKIVLAKDGGPALSAETLGKNIEALFDCAYVDFGIKPYWIPRLVVDADVCGRKLGAGWRLPTAGDFASWTESERSAIAAASSVELFNSRILYVRGTDGSAQLGNLVTGEVGPITGAGLSYAGDTYHYEGGAALRCLRGS